eukprot:2936967-Prymnesium_polylepis.1
MGPPRRVRGARAPARGARVVRACARATTRLPGPIENAETYAYGNRINLRKNTRATRAQQNRTVGGSSAAVTLCQWVSPAPNIDMVTDAT